MPEKIEINITNNARAFVALTRRYIRREGVEDLIEFLEKESDFFYAPCSTIYHLSQEGGLCAHSLSVWEIFNRLCEEFYPTFPAESRAIVSLYHDLCKHHTYNPCRRSRKTGELYPNGKPIWEDYDAYEFVEELPLGHGEKSVYLLMKYIKLTDEEALAIRWHMGAFDEAVKGGSRAMSNAQQKSTAVSLLHCADLISTATGM